MLSGVWLKRLCSVSCCSGFCSAWSKSNTAAAVWLLNINWVQGRGDDVNLQLWLFSCVSLIVSEFITAVRSREVESVWWEQHAAARGFVLSEEMWFYCFVIGLRGGTACVTTWEKPQIEACEASRRDPRWRVCVGGQNRASLWSQNVWITTSRLITLQHTHTSWGSAGMEASSPSQCSVLERASTEIKTLHWHHS